MLIEEVEIKGQVVGVVAAIGKGRVGYSICNPIEKYRLGRAMEIAVGRARKNRSVVVGLEKTMMGFHEERGRINWHTIGHEVTGKRINRRTELFSIINRVGRVLSQLRAIEARSKLLTW